MANAGTVLLFGLNWIGDAVMSLPAVHAIHEARPDARLVVAARGWSADIYRMCPAVDEVVALEKGSWLSPAAFFSTVGTLRRFDADLAVILPNSFSSALKVYCARISERAGYNTDVRGFLLTSSTGRPAQENRHTVLYYKELLEECLQISWPENNERFELEIDAADEAAVAELRRAEGIEPGSVLLGIAPGAAWGEAKRWPAENFAACADQLLEASSCSVAALFGSSDDEELNAGICEAMKHKAINLAGRFSSLGQLTAVIKACRLLVCNDSGPMHLAAAIGTPLVALFGPSDENKSGPWAPASRAVTLRAPGSKPWKNFRRGSNEPRTMGDIAVADVVAAGLRLIQEN